MVGKVLKGIGVGAVLTTVGALSDGCASTNEKKSYTELNEARYNAQMVQELGGKYGIVKDAKVVERGKRDGKALYAVEVKFEMPVGVFTMTQTETDFGYAQRARLKESLEDYGGNLSEEDYKELQALAEVKPVSHGTRKFDQQGAKEALVKIYVDETDVALADAMKLAGELVGKEIELLLPSYTTDVEIGKLHGESVVVFKDNFEKYIRWKQSFDARELEMHVDGFSELHPMGKPLYERALEKAKAEISTGGLGLTERGMKALSDSEEKQGTDGFLGKDKKGSGSGTK